MSGYSVAHLDEIGEISEAEEYGGQEELYLVHRGRARFELDGEQADPPTGTFVFVPRGVKRTAFAEEPGTTLIAVGGTPGEAYEPSGYELWAPVAALYQAGEYAEAADRGLELLDEHPEFPILTYNVACCESLAGRRSEALEHLRRAAERSERLRRFASGDSDFDPIREEPAFKELVG